MRIAGQARLGFYPTPDRVMQLLSAWIQPHPDGWTLLDPCCGEGAARLLDAPLTYGIELEANRAQLTREQGGFTEVLTGDIESARVPLKSISALYLNPPYDDGLDGRVELDFLRRATPWLQPQGLLLFVVPGKQVKGVMAQYLAQRYDFMGCWRFPNPEYQAYGQVVVVARKRAVPMTVGASGQAISHAVATAPVLGLPSASDALWEVPPGEPIHLRGAEWDPNELLIDLTTAQGGGWTTVFQKSAQRTQAADAVITTPLTLHRGHLALMLAAGQVRGVMGHGDVRHAVKGRVQVETVTDTKTKRHSDGTASAVEIERTVHRVELTVIRADSTVVHLLSSVPQEVDDEDDEEAESE